MVELCSQLVTKAIKMDYMVAPTSNLSIWGLRQDDQEFVVIQATE